MQKSELDVNDPAVEAESVNLINGRSSTAGPGNGRVGALNTCPQCTCPDDQRLLSRHPTADGLLTYTRCRCGALHVWLWPQDAAAARHLARGRRCPAG